jgi:transcriptional regulator with XRE-family HTH domain
MAPGVSPAAARRRLRMAIRDARMAKGVTQMQVAEALEWSLSKVMRIESGEVTISQNDLRPLLGYLGVREKSEVDGLIALAKASKQRRQWWDQPRFAGLFTPAMKQWFGYEVEATSMRIFCAVYFPGFLQTPEFARSMLAFFDDELTSAEIAARVEARALRRQGFAARAVKPEIQLLLDESVLLRSMGRPEMLRQQIAELLSGIDDGWMSVRVMPFTHPSPGIGNWEIFYLGAVDIDHAVLYRENSTKDEIIDDAAGLYRHLLQWEKMWHGSFDEAQSREIIEARANDVEPGRAGT